MYGRILSKQGKISCNLSIKNPRIALTFQVFYQSGFIINYINKEDILMSLKDSDKQKWNYTEHAKVKHLLLQKYLPVWITILGSRYKRIYYFDGFAGRGEYNDGNPGSPLLALEALKSVYNNTSVRGFEYNCIFVEKNLDNFNNLKEVVERERSSLPSACNVYYKHADFDSYINNVLDKFEKSGKRLPPSFFFIDPFGYTGVNFNAIKRILHQPKTEVFLNFMVRDVNRFLKLKHQEKNMNTLFGNDKWKDLLAINDKERQTALRDLYVDNLIETGAAKYVWPFRVCQDDNE